MQQQGWTRGAREREEDRKRKTAKRAKKRGDGVIYKQTGTTQSEATPPTPKQLPPPQTVFQFLSSRPPPPLHPRFSNVIRRPRGFLSPAYLMHARDRGAYAR